MGIDRVSSNFMSRYMLLSLYFISYIVIDSYRQYFVYREVYVHCLVNETERTFQSKKIKIKIVTTNIIPCKKKYPNRIRERQQSLLVNSTITIDEQYFTIVNSVSNDDQQCHTILLDSTCTNTVLFHQNYNVCALISIVRKHVGLIEGKKIFKREETISCTRQDKIYVVHQFLRTPRSIKNRSLLMEDKEEVEE